MTPFTFNLPTKIIFGYPAAAAIQAELASLNVTQVLLVSDPGLVQLGLVNEISQPLTEAGVELTIFTALSSNPTSLEVAAGLEMAQAANVQALVALGGGSAIDVGKGIAMLLANGGTYAEYQWGGKAITQRSLPLLAVPTTAGTGSEVSKVAVIIDPTNPLKKGVLSPLMFPYAAIIDPQLTRSLPPWLTAATGMDALIHALETYLGLGANPFSDELALLALRKTWQTLPQATANGEDMTARQSMMLAALWAGTAMDHAGLGLVHALSGPLTGYLHLHHGLTNALLLPYVMRFNLQAISPDRRRTLNKIFGLPLEATDDALIKRLASYVRDLGLPTHLGELGVSLAGVPWDDVATETTRMTLIKNNPRPVTEADCRTILQEMLDDANIPIGN